MRNSSQARQSHVKGAYSIPTSQLAAAKGKLPKIRKAPIVLYSDNETEAINAFKTVRSWGYSNTSILNGGFNAWVQAKGPVESGASPTEIVYIPAPAPGSIAVDKFTAIARNRPADFFILDARSPEEASKGKLVGAVNIPTQDIINRLNEIPKDKKIVIHCRTGVRAEMAYQTLKENGYDASFLKAKIQIKPDGRFRIKS